MKPADARILVADDEANIISLLKKVLGEEGYTLFTAGGGKEACEIAEREQVHLALVDLTMPDRSGLDVLKHIKERQPSTQVVIMTAFATAETAVEAMKQGALDYLIKPFSLDELKLQIRRALDEVALAQENRALRQEIRRSVSDDALIGEHPAIQEALALVRKVADTDTTVLILGETGTGKELIARALHHESRRRNGTFLALNCGAIPESMLERELFGHERGAFTGADSTSPGLLEAATDGTLFLDEIAEMPASLQVKLLRVLEGHEFLRLGGTKPIKSHVRFIAATNKNITLAVTAGNFREDLYHRLNVLNITLPPLRERGEDIMKLADHFLDIYARRSGPREMKFADEALALLQSYAWPGNVRELKNVIERAVILCKSTEIVPADLRLEPSALSPSAVSTSWTNLSYRDARDAFERDYLAQVLKTCRGNISQTAERIGLDRKNLQDKIKKYGLNVQP